MQPKAEASYHYGDPTGMTLMTETDAPVAKARPSSPQEARDRQRISMALHLDCSRAYISKLETLGVIERQGDGFPLDQSRVACIRHLRRERRLSARTEADAEHAKAKTELLQIKIMEKQRKLVLREDVDALIDQMAGITLTHLSGMAARCGSRDMQGPARHRRGRGSDQARDSGGETERSWLIAGAVPALFRGLPSLLQIYRAQPEIGGSGLGL